MTFLGPPKAENLNNVPYLCYSEGPRGLHACLLGVGMAS